MRGASKRLLGAYALAVASPDEPDRIVVARVGSPLVIGVGLGENFIASDVFALLPVTQNFIFLDEGDIAEIRRKTPDAPGPGHPARAVQDAAEGHTTRDRRSRHGQRGAKKAPDNAPPAVSNSVPDPPFRYQNTDDALPQAQGIIHNHLRSRCYCIFGGRSRSRMA